jgi:hypothetical protein
MIVGLVGSNAKLLVTLAVIDDASYRNQKSLPGSAIIGSKTRLKFASITSYHTGVGSPR